jgi:predicted acetyltransferase
MLRVVDAPAAIAARGFPAEVSVRVPVQIADGARPANSGRWQLTVAGGAGTLEPMEPDAPADTVSPASTALTLGARGLAALYAGTPVATLRQAGLAAGGTPAGDAALDAAFAATPYMLDGF